MSENQPITLRRNFSWTFIGNAVYAGCQWGMLVVMAKFGSPEMVGQFSLGLAVTTPIIMFTNLQLRVIQATDAKKQYIFSDYLGLRLLSTTVALLIITSISFSGLYRGEISSIILLIAVARAFECISDVLYGLIQQQERMDRIGISQVIKGVLSLLFLYLGLYFTGQLAWGVAGLIVAWAFVLLTYDIPSGILLLKQKNKLKPRLDIKTVGKLLKLCLPLGLVMMLVAFNSNIPRYFIEYHLGERELGLFAPIAYVTYAGQTLEGALEQSTSSRLAQYYMSGQTKAFINLLLKLISLGLVIGVTATAIAIVGGKLILSLLYTADYVKYSDIFVWFMVIMTVEYVASFLCYGLIAARYLRVQVPVLLTVTATSFISCLWLVPLYGVKGAVASILIASLVRAIISAFVILHAINKLTNVKPFYRN
jgi:O-antigen/teichoic acid export membrane protein